MKKVFRFSLTVLLVGVLFCACFVTPAAAKTTSGKIGGGFTWTLDDQTGELILSGNGDIEEDAFEEFQQKVLISNKNNIKNIIIEENIKSIYTMDKYLSNTALPNLQTVLHKIPNGFSWEMDFVTSTMTISGNGKCPDLEPYFWASYGWPYIAYDYQTLKINDGITDMENCSLPSRNCIIGKNCKNIGSLYVFESFEVDSTNPTYASYEGSLYTKDYTKLLKTPSEKEGQLSFHPNLAIIGDQAFRMVNVDNLDIVIPWGVTTIEGSLFPSGSSGTGPIGATVVLPETLKNWNREVGGGGMMSITFLFGEGSQIFESGYYGTGVEFWPLLPKERYYSIYGITPNSLKTFQNGKTYYFDQNCKMAKGWKQVNGTWYYFNDYGAAVVKIWLKSGNKWYFMQADGTMATNKWVQWYNKWYYVGSDGAMYANRWIKSSGKWYYLGSDGVMYTNRYTPDGCWVNGSGVWVK